VKSLLQKNSYDFIFCYSSQVIQYALSANIPKIIDFIDLDSDKWRQYAKKSIFPLNIIYHIEFKRLAKFEKKAWQEFSLSVFSTGQEVKLFEKYGISNEKVTVLGNGVDHQFFSPIYCKRIKALTFTGAMDYLPNIDAVTWFCKSIFPEILRAVPDVKFYIVGSNPPKEIQTLASDSVIVTGFVDDIRTYIAQSWLAVYPLRIARGIQNKILEAMAMGITPVVPESLRSSLDDAWPQEVLFFNSENDCISLIIDSLRRFNPDAPVCDNLRKYILTKRDWTRRLDAFQTLVKDLVQ
jgi:sugar transferase (PEP-CTERM/EpsH1 system associated)